MSKDQPPAPRSRRRTLIVACCLIVAAASLGGAGWFAWKTWGAAPSADQVYITATIQRGSIEDLVAATGSLQPRDFVDVGAQVSGQLRKLHVEVGSQVSEGDLLAEIDAETSTARVEASRAQLQSQLAQLGERELNLAKAERDLGRQKNLWAEEATTHEALQNAETAARVARAQINSLKAQMDQLRASMRVEEANLKFTRIYAPMSGTVVSIAARQGQTLNANQSAPTIMRVADLSTMNVQTQVSEADVSRLYPGMTVYFTTLGSGSRRWYGRLKLVEPTPTVTNNVVLYNALFEVPNANRSLMTQMTVQVFYVVAGADDVLMVPMAAVSRGGGQRRGDEKAAAGDAEKAERRTAGPGKRPERDAGATPAGNGGSASAAPGAESRPRSAAATQASPEREGGERRRGPSGEGQRLDREALQKMSPEERQRLREQFRQGAGRREGEDRRPGGSRPQRGPSADAAAKARPGGRRAIAPAGGTDSAGAPSSPVRQPRRVMARVVAADGSIEDREVTIGITNRIHAEVLSGLAEGERVIAGLRQPTNPRGSAQQQQQRGIGPGGMPGAPKGVR